MDWTKVVEQIPVIGLMTQQDMKPWLSRITESIIISALTATAILYTSYVRQTEQINSLSSTILEIKVKENECFKLSADARDIANQALTRTQLQQETINRNSKIIDNMHDVEIMEHKK